MATNNTPRGGNQGRLAPIPERNRPATVALLAERFGLMEDELQGYGVHDLPNGRGVGMRYRDTDGAELFVRTRTAVFAKDHTRQPKGVPLAPYGLWRLHLAHSHKFLVLVEGESDCWCGWHHGLPFLGIPGWGASQCIQAPHVADIPTVYVCREPDKGGEGFAKQAPERLRGIGYRGRIYELTMANGAKDPGEVFRQAPGLFPELLADRIKVARELLPLPPTPPTPIETNGQTKAREAPPAAQTAGKEDELPAAQSLVGLALADGLELFHDDTRRGYARWPGRGHRPALPVRGREFSHYLHRLWREANGRPLPKGTRETVVEDLDARACDGGRELSVHVRRAVVNGLTYRDLGDPKLGAVEIGPGGWKVVEDPPAVFRRPVGMLPLPAPDRAGSLDELRPFLNLRDEDQWALLVGWLLAAARGIPPYPVLVITGQAGSGKSLLAWVIKDLLDPSVTDRRAEPKKIHDVYIAAGLCELLVYDNLSKLDGALSDALCVVASGGVHATRTLHSNDEEFPLRASNPIAITAIEDVGTRSDLLSRSVLLDLPPLGSGMRWSEEELMREWEANRPRVLGGLCNALAGALAELPAVDYDRDCRMPHLAQMGAAAGRVLGWPEGAFTLAYAANRQEAAETALEAQPVVVALGRLLADRDDGCWEGTAAELLDRLRELAGPGADASPGWPKLPHHLSGRLKRLAGDLKTRGILFDRGRSGDHQWGRRICLTRLPAGPEAPGAASE